MPQQAGMPAVLATRVLDMVEHRMPEAPGMVHRGMLQAIQPGNRAAMRWSLNRRSRLRFKMPPDHCTFRMKCIASV
jgi:hypothetical protein